MKGHRAILKDGTKVICVWEQNQTGDGKKIISCFKSKNNSLEIKTFLILVDTKPEEEWKWRCTPDPLME